MLLTSDFSILHARCLLIILLHSEGMSCADSVFRCISQGYVELDKLPGDRSLNRRRFSLGACKPHI